MSCRTIPILYVILAESSIVHTFDLIKAHTASFWYIIIQWTSYDDLKEKLVSLVSLAKLIKKEKFKTALCDLTEKLLASNFVGRPNLQGPIEKNL